MKAATVLPLSYRASENKLTSRFPSDQPYEPLFDVQRSFAQIEKADFFETMPMFNFFRELVSIKQEFADFKKTKIKEINALKDALANLEQLAGERTLFTPADRIYERFKVELEKDHFGEIVAIDDESGCIVGIADTLSDAYERAKKATGKEQFDFKRVGYGYLFRI
jgi:hypothetical protein